VSDRHTAPGRASRRVAAPWGLVALFAAGVLAPPGPLPAAGPKVRLIATGGTISNRAGGRLTAEELVRLIPDLDQYVQAESEQFSNLPSSALTLDDWLRLARRINQCFRDDPGLAGLVVTSGTDTLEELAYFLHLTVRSDRPVVVVGSMRNPSTLGYEGAANLRDAFRVAAEPASRGKGVLVVLNDEINSAREVTKTDALRLHTFQTRGYGVLGVVDPDRVVYYRDVVKRHTIASEFDVARIDRLPRVDVLLTYQGAPGDLIRAAVDRGAKGIVLATAGAGATSGTQAEGVDYALEKGVIVVTATRTGSGRIAPRGTGPGGRGGAAVSAEERRLLARRVAAEDLAPLKARVLLMLALAVTDDPAEIQRMFREY
jgi:L-asparaginase